MALIAKVDISLGCDKDFVKKGDDASKIPEPMLSRLIEEGIVCDDQLNNEYKLESKQLKPANIEDLIKPLNCTPAVAQGVLTTWN